MSDPVALLRDEGDPLVIDGATTVREVRSGDVTSNPLPDRTYAADGKTRRPGTVSIEALISPNPTLTGLTTGDARLLEVRAWLERADRDTDVLSIQVPRAPLLVNYVVVSYTLETGNTDSLRLSLELVEVVIASSQSVTLERQTRPTEEAEPGAAEEVDKGTTTTEPIQSLASAILFGSGGLLAGADG